MLSFSCEFPVPATATRDSVCALIRTWLIGSRYTHFNSASLAQLGDGETWDAVEETEHIESLVEKTSDIESCAVTYRKNDGKFEWITTIVLAEQPSGNWISVRVECEPLHPTAQVPPAKKPVFVKQLLESFGGGIDGAFAVNDAPVVLKHSEVGLAADCIQGYTGCYLPIVYVSAAFSGGYLVDPNELASTLAGMAHVIVEPNRTFSAELMNVVERRNPYGGTVALYWPESGGRRSFFSREGTSTPAEICDAIFKEVRLSLNHRRPLSRCTINAVKELRSRRQINALRDAGSAEVDSYIAAFEGELKARLNALEVAETEIHRLKAEIRRFEAQDTLNTGLSLQLGTECDLYESEIMSIVCGTLEAEISNVVADSRTQHVLTALVAANPIPDERIRYREQIKATLRGYQKMDTKTRKDLEGMGFSISDAGKHYKLVFNDDERYTHILPKSGSDYRGGLNAAGDFSRLLFR